MGADEDASDGNEHRSSQEDDPDGEVEGKHDECDGERRARMVTRERRVGRARPRMPDRVRFVRSRPVPNRMQDDVHQEGKRGGRERAAGRKLPFAVSSRPS